MKSNSELGTFIRKTAISKAMLYIAYPLFVFLTGLSVFIYFILIRSINDGSINFSEDISVLYYSIAFLMTLAILLLVLAIYISRGPIFYIYENAIIIKNKDTKKTLFIKDIQDVYLFTSGKNILGINNIAFRTNNTEDWYPISARYSAIYIVIKFLRSRHAELYTPLVLKKLEEGHAVNFTYVDFSNLVMKQFAALNTKSYLNIKTKTMQLYKDKLVVESETIYFADLLSFSVSDWTNQIQLTNRANKIVFKKAFTSVFSGDSFAAVLDELVNKNKIIN